MDDDDGGDEMEMTVMPQFDICLWIKGSRRG